MNTITALSSYPKSGRIVPEYGEPSLRERIYQGYRIVYRLRADAVEIVAICHGARRIEKALDS